MLSTIFGHRLNAGSAQTQSLVAGNTAFALDLYSQIKATPGNLFFSPYSISTALSMVYAGARGDTEKQMSQVLHFGKDQSQLHGSLGELQKQLKEAGQQQGIELNIANALWAQAGHPFLPSFLDVARGDYQANIDQVDFKTAAETARSAVNSWVAQQTKNKIQDILPAGSVDNLTRLVLANAIYFKGVWAKPYDQAQTSKQTFYRSKTDLASVPLMHHFDHVRYLENTEYQAVELPYRNDALSMLVVLPRQVEGWAELERRLTPGLLSDVLTQMKPRQVEIYFPRFKLESEFNLNHTLAKMGMPDAFGLKADFSGIDGTRNLFVSGVFHKAWGEVNEEGTEAAAATAVAVATRAIRQAPPPPPVFRADHPFIFFIRDGRSGSLLFLGRLANPVS